MRVIYRSAGPGASLASGTTSGAALPPVDLSGSRGAIESSQEEEAEEDLQKGKNRNKGMAIDQKNAKGALADMKKKESRKAIDKGGDDSVSRSLVSRLFRGGREKEGVSKKKKAIQKDRFDSATGSSSLRGADSDSDEKEAEKSKPPPTIVIPSLTLSSIAKAQDFDGGFKGTENNIKFLLQGSGKENVPIPSTLDTVKNISAEDKATVWTTIIALAVLGKRFSSNEERSAWNLLAEKANEFITGVLSDAGLGSAEVEQLISKLKTEAETVV